MPSEPPAAFCSSSSRGYAPPYGGTKRSCRDRYLSKLLQLAIAIRQNDMMVYIVIFDRKAYQISSKLFADINAYIDDRYVEEHRDSYVHRGCFDW